MIKNIKNSKFFLQCAAMIGAMVPFAVAFAADTSVFLPNPLTNCSGGTIMSCVVTPVINFVYVIAVPICTIMVLWGAFTMMTAAGDPEKFSTGKNTILYAAVGFLVVLLAGSVVAIIQNTFSGS